jgi:hypothetical protein
VTITNSEAPAASRLAGTRYALLGVMANIEAHGSAASRTVQTSPPLSAALDQEQIAELHSHDSSSVAPSRADQPRVLLRSPTMWALLYVPTLLVLSAVGYMLLHLHRGDPGRVPGSGDRDSPNAQPGDK